MMSTFGTPARSYLFVPGTRAERFGKALAAGADRIVLDLEDAVALEAEAASPGAARLDGRMVDRPVVLQAQRLLQRADP